MIYTPQTTHFKQRQLSLVLSIALLLSISIQQVIGQNLYDTRLSLTSIDTANAIACYDLQLSNPGLESWSLSTHNLNVFYDASAACYLSDSLVASAIVFRHNINQSIVGGGLIMNSGLPYEDSLGFMRLNLSFVQAGDGLTIDTTGEWYSTINVCFSLKLDNITDPSTCFRMDFSDDVSRTAVGVFPDIVQQWDPNDLPVPVDLNSNQNNIPNATKTTCFILEENTETLCSDNIDNDEDGLTDCFDDECSPGDIMVNVKSIECFDPNGAITLSGGEGILTYSIDGGVTFSSDSAFNNLTAGLYDIVVTDNGISSCSFTSTISVQAPATSCTESSEADCMDGIDNDNNGLIDCADEGCQPRVDDVMVVLPFVCPELDDGMIDIMSTFPNVEYSIDSGFNYFPDPVFTDLGEDTFYVFVRNMTTLCEFPYDLNPIILMALDTCVVPNEVCSDGVDNDFDGLTDCFDDDCASNANCLDLPNIYIPNIIDLRSSMNNVFKIDAERPVQVQSAIIYNRWGNKVYEDINTEFLTEGWNGSVNNSGAKGGLVESGVYVYHIQFNVDGLIVDRLGDVTIIR